MKRLLFKIAPLAVLVFAVQIARAQRDLSQVQIRKLHVAGNVHMFQGAGGNLGISAGPDGILLIDDDYATLAPKILEALDSLGQGELRFLVNTHWHGDHTGGNPVFGTLAPIIAHANARKRLESGGTFAGRSIPPTAKEGLPVLTFDQSITLHFNGEEIRVIHFPRGHTDGDSVVYFVGSNVIHMGDHFFKDRFPVVDLDSGGDVEGMTANVGTIIESLPEGVKIIPGHGELATPDDLKAFHRMLIETTEIVRKRKSEGMTLEQNRAAGLAESWEPWGSGYISTERWLDTIYASLSGSRGG